MIFNILYKSKFSHNINYKKRLIKIIGIGLSIYTLLCVILQYIGKYDTFNKYKLYIVCAVFVDFIALLINYNKKQQPNQQPTNPPNQQPNQQPTNPPTNINKEDNIPTYEPEILKN